MNKTAIVTGASKGIGRAIAEEFAARDYHVILISRDFSGVHLVAEELYQAEETRGTQGKLYLPYEVDISDADAVEEAFAEIRQRTGSLDVLVNNAGINSRKSINLKDSNQFLHNFKENLAGWKEELEINLTGTFICSYQAAAYMRYSKNGSIINISSIKGIEPTTSPGYGASKAGVVKLTKDLARAFAPEGIRVNCISPGFINTGMTAELPKDKKEAYLQKIPLGRLGEVHEVAQLAAFLASNEARYITGQNVVIDGGYLG